MKSATRTPVTDELGDVLVVGAGPTGLVLALLLLRHGVRPRVIDAAPRIAPESRAVAVHARTLEIYRLLGLADVVQAAGHPSSRLVLARKGRPVGALDLGSLGRGLSAFPRVLFLSQHRHEALLADALAARGVTVERGQRLLDLAQDVDGVLACWSGPGGAQYASRFRFVVGCDGASSTVRQLLGIGFPGSTYPQRFYVADVEGRGAIGTGGLTVHVGADGFCALLPLLADERLRVIGVVPAHLKAMHSPQPANIEPWVKELTGLELTRVHWWSVYRVHLRTAERLRAGRVLLAGDAAHVHSPAGGQGINTGIGDAANLGWKLAQAVRRPAQAEVLFDTYAHERLAIARQVLASIDRMFGLLNSQGLVGRIWRTRVLPVMLPFALRSAALRRRAFLTVSQTGHAYPRGPLAAGRHGAIAGGMHLPWVPGLNNHALVARAVGWQIHGFAPPSPELTFLASAARLPAHTLPWSDAAAMAGFKRDGLYLVRPDGHVALAATQHQLDKLEALLPLTEPASESASAAALDAGNTRGS
jgi:2-polyprenyl-6-methoxyphenol hydroxylase-like FAD-dependent oxidoreductase